ncbi:hypothetical protein HK104_004635 [Borealophlyctis nickersoniae]|nr:hypothetical protein HK104_004635 [Borealophlyctis nickersoniae]
MAVVVKGLVLTAFFVFNTANSAARPVVIPPAVKEIMVVRPAAGGSWHIPSSWLYNASLPANLTIHPQTIYEAAHLASYLATSSPDRQVPHTNIPLIIHQTYKTTDPRKWPKLVLDCVASWILASYLPRDRTGEEAVPDQYSQVAAYFMWDDEGMDSAVRMLWPEGYQTYLSLPANVMRADVFRIFVLRWFGGVYADADTRPLRHPSDWVHPTDLTPWRDPQTSELHTPIPPISLLVGIEADLPPQSDLYWRMGYGHPVELTQWALSGASHHPALINMLDRVSERVAELKQIGGLERADALELTGPFRWTDVVKEYLEAGGGFRWNALSGLEDGGRAKGVKDVLVLPITGFR